MSEPIQMTNAEFIFRTKFREDWAKFLSTEAGHTFISTLYSHKPAAIPSSLPHQDSHRLGQIMNFDLMMEFIAVTLTQPIQSVEEVPQNYPPEEETQPSQTPEKK